MSELQTKTRILILQHPQEPDREFGSVPVLKEVLPGIKIAVGLSWPNLTKALHGPKSKTPSPEPEDITPVIAKEWGTLFLGSQSIIAGMKDRGPGLYAVQKTGLSAVPRGLKGLIVLDGTWAQGKTLWWRNAWLLKTHRLVLIPPKASLYGKLRKEPRKECVSTLESVAYGLSALGEPKGIEEQLLGAFQDFLNKLKASRADAK